MTETDIREPLDAALAETSAPEAGVETAGYAVGREVARGGMGRIVAAEDKRIGRQVALKELIKKTPTLEARFAREARVTARLQHPGIVPIYEIGTWPDGTPFYTMRMVEGRTLRVEIADRATVEARLALLPAMIAAADAVAFAHGRRVIHRDLTPNNVLVGAYGETVVIDWGLAKSLSDPEENLGEIETIVDAELTSAGTVMGTLAYMPPEQARGDAVDERADVFALGCMLAHVLSGVAPSPTLAELAADQVAVLDVPGAPRDLVSIARKATSPAPADRYANAGELADELRRFQNGRIVEAHAYSRGERLRRWVRAHRAAVLASLALVVGVVVAGGIGLAGVLRARDRAEDSAVAAEASAAKASSASSSYLEELGRQKLLAGEPQQAAVFLSAAYSAGDTSPELRFMLGSAMRAVEGERLVFVGSSEPVRSIHVSPDARRALVVHRTIAEQWSLDDGAKLATLAAPNLQLVDAAYAGDGATIISWGDDEITRIWSSTSGHVLRTLPAGLISGAALSPDGTAALTVRKDGQTRLWDAVTGDARTSEPPLGRFVAALGPYVVAARASGRYALREWSGRTFEIPEAITLDVSRDGSSIVSCTGKDIMRWSPAGKLLQRWTNHRPYPLVGCSLDDSDRVIAFDAAGVVLSWALELVGYSKSSSDIPSEVFLGNPVREVGGVGQRLLAVVEATSSLELRGAHKGELLARYPIDVTTHPTPVPGDKPMVLVAHPDGTVALLSISPSRIRSHERIDAPTHLISKTKVVQIANYELAVHDLQTGHHVGPLRVEGEGNLWSALSVSGRLVAARGRDVTIFDADTGAIVGRIATEPVHRLVISVDGTQIALQRMDNVVEVWNGDGTARLATVPAPSSVHALGNAAADDSAFVLVFHGRFLHRLWKGGRDERIDLRGGSALPFSDSTLASVESFDGSRLAILDAARTAKVFDLPTGKKLLELVATQTETVSFSPDNRLIALGGATTELIDIASGKRIGQVSTPHGMLAGSRGDLVLSAAGVFSALDGRQLDSSVDISPSSKLNFGGSGDASSLMIDGGSGGVDFLDLRLEDRTSDAVARVVAARVPWRLETNQLVPVHEAGVMPTVPARLHLLVRERGTPVRAAHVAVENGEAVEADVNGTALLGNLSAGNVILRATSATAVARPREIYLHGGDNELAIDLEQRATLDGKVVTRDGAPIPGVRVETQVLDCDSPTRFAVTTERGEFVLTGLPGGCTAAIGISPSPDDDVHADLAQAPYGPDHQTPSDDDAHVEHLTLVGVPTIRPSDADHPADLIPLPANAEARLRTPSNDTSSNVLFENASNGNVQLMYLDGFGRRKLLARVAKGEHLSMRSGINHPLLIADESNKLIGIYLPDALFSRLVIR